MPRTPSPTPLGSGVNYNKGNYHELVQFLDIDWDKELEASNNDIEHMWKTLKNKIQEATDKFIPTISSCKTYGAEKWKRALPKPVREEIKIKNRLYKKYMHSRNEEERKRYRKQSNHVRGITRQIEMDEQRDIANRCKTNPKAFWSYVNKRTKNKNPIPDLVVAGPDGSELCISKDLDKAEVFSDYFSAVFNHDTTAPGGDLPQINSEQSMAEIHFDVDTIRKKLSSLNVYKSPGPDNIHPKILKEAAAVLAYPLYLIFQCSLESDCLPLDWKSGNITAIYKKGRKCLPNNYRPISLTSIICKVFESIVRTHLMKYFLEHNLFSEKQFGFLSKRSTVTQLLQILDTWTNQLEMGGQIDVIYTDLEKAFDKVPHHLLLKKLQNYLVDNKVKEWIASFLCNRRQRVGISNSFSSWRSVVSGIPQGSILGPFLFLVYINDIVSTCDDETSMFLYADDTKLFRYVGCPQDSKILQTDLQSLHKWIKEWLLSLNIEKCKIVSYGRQKQDTNYEIDGTQLERVTNIKDLGVIFDSDLKFHTHVNTIIGKAYAILGLINRNFRYMKTEVFIQLYKAMVRSHLEYAGSVWSPYMKGDIEKLERVQMRATRMVQGVRHLSYLDRLKFLNLPTLRYRRQRGDMIEVFKIMNGNYENFRPFSCLEQDRYNLRGNSKKLPVGYCKGNLRKYNFTCRVVGLWNSLPESVVTSESLNIFKARLDKHWRSQELCFDWTVDIGGTGNRSALN